ncbi:hypothetical protein CLAFUW4_01497 [Fulvia fulva]|uniref:Berberine/berberine-like domain-containing protein n=1 Tax=Passalora fulva TaxID=5499 RepID=A0A9Q8L5Y9_PASFU|nr:uncharacterized protein CLAFUR5_01499 [Fulvia fulva]KAK4636070.1 hypothetical protein CLAFUR4_01498 [Fulvia fulva]KAK4637548.1 hypothetical protein CLAFUR0_01499 [Fulvia fulva]UJO11485.1 hypothetical protein CLAFUR5_01499 [Fulvia fulva]WPV08610.1 hypothetical protein CLAFUW4_01497 [Fulvia fulva]WPV23437.1 hypothetical protein CLAFUW7_01502 [Fulvia fulva]
MVSSMSTFLAIGIPAVTASLTKSELYCKPRPGDAAWPDADTWNSLTQSVNGNLIAPTPVGAVCHTGWPQSDVVLPRVWKTLNQTEKEVVTTDLRDVRVRALRDLSPDTGAYMSESDPTEPEWQKTKFGEHYNELLRIKQRWDPNGVFWCKQCVGSELWEAKGDFGIENGVGQSKVQLCRVEKIPHRYLA